ncbi:hypothetical protein LTR78_006923 [Recurvomyces mirabilis]|uniref:Uncharacterized protein n=1 Tax=Recurvomyces mirabilis TaxID=574656 RepID=A0AAE0WJX2_9PEZI|nr:hypothetical protein LTR78_006923 [Recurvomyces mirabilis]KAK5153307.1 hypothetical protein LTS14_007476 [Recurvomyces mirabilis]
MTLKDFFHLSESDFADRISRLPDEKLLKDDIHNVRATHSGAIGATLGAIEAPATAGLSLVGSAIGLRRRKVAKRRLEMIHAELESRGLPSHRQTKRDFLIPLAISGATMGIGGPAVEGLMGAIPVQSVLDAGIDAGTTAASMVVGEVAGKLTAEVGGENVVDRSLPGTGRKGVWRRALGISRSIEGFGGAVENGGEGDRVESPVLAVSAPGSPVYEMEGPPMLPPRPLLLNTGADVVGTVPEIVVTAPKPDDAEQAASCSRKILRMPVTQ